MIVDVIKSGRLAVDPRTQIAFNKGDILESGKDGWTEVALNRLVEIGCAKEKGDTKEEVKEVKIEAIEVDVKTGEPVIPEYYSIKKKSKLETYALETYGIDLDRRLSLNGMIEQLENKLNEEN